MTAATKDLPLINIDQALSQLAKHEVTAQVIDAYVSAYSYKNFDDIPKRLPFVLELCTKTYETWLKLVELAPHRYWIREKNQGVLVFNASEDCGYTRTYRYRSDLIQSPQQTNDISWTRLQSEDVLYAELNTIKAKSIFDAWIKDKDAVMALPTEFVTGRLQNTNVEKAIIFSKGRGCGVCGKEAMCYAATTVGVDTAALLVQLPVCSEHLATAKEYPTIFQFLMSLLQQEVDWTEVQKLDAVPDNLIHIIHQLVSAELGAHVTGAEKRDRGWHLFMTLPSGWHWLLRLNTFTDYAYMLFEPQIKNERYRADSAKDHPELRFFPDHEHSRPQHKKDQVGPSFLYGHPLFDLKQLRNVGTKLGAYLTDNVSVTSPDQL